MRWTLFISVLFLFGSLLSQPGPINNLRYEDDFSYLLADSTEARGFEKLKYQTLGKHAHISVGGEIREWYEFRANVNFGDTPPGYLPDPDGALLHRLMLHADYWNRDRFRFFVQFNNTLQIGSPNAPIPEIIQDGLGLHQLFGEVKLLQKTPQALSFRVGRQEFNFGNELVISSREGPNNRMAFDGVSLILQTPTASVHAFGATPVIIEPGLFDNRHINERVWGLYAYLRQQKSVHLDVYYFGMDTDRRVFQGETGRQLRHTLGSRVSHRSMNWQWEAEAMYQFGTFNALSIRAYNLSGELFYSFDLPFRPTLGLAGSYITGDKSQSDNLLNTYEMMYPKPTYGLALAQGPSNIQNIRPILGVRPLPTLIMNASVYFLSRQSADDGSYAPDMTPVRPFPPFESAKLELGQQYALETFFFPTHNWTFMSFLSYVQAGDYVLETGSGKPVFFFSASAAFKF